MQCRRVCVPQFVQHPATACRWGCTYREGQYVMSACFETSRAGVVYGSTMVACRLGACGCRTVCGPGHNTIIPAVLSSRPLEHAGGIVLSLCSMVRVPVPGSKVCGVRAVPRGKAAWVPNLAKRVAVLLATMPVPPCVGAAVAAASFTIVLRILDKRAELARPTMYGPREKQRAPNISGRSAGQAAHVYCSPFVRFAIAFLVSELT